MCISVEFGNVNASQESVMRVLASMWLSWQTSQNLLSRYINDATLVCVTQSLLLILPF